MSYCGAKSVTKQIIAVPSPEVVENKGVRPEGVRYSNRDEGTLG